MTNTTQRHILWIIQKNYPLDGLLGNFSLEKYISFKNSLSVYVTCIYRTEQLAVRSRKPTAVHISKTVNYMGGSVCRDSSVGIATRYGLDGPGIDYQGGEVFHTRHWGPPSLLYNGYRVSFQGVKRPGREFDQPPPSSAEVKESVEPHLFSPSRPAWPVLGLSFITGTSSYNFWSKPAVSDINIMCETLYVRQEKGPVEALRKAEFTHSTKRSENWKSPTLFVAKFTMSNFKLCVRRFMR